MLRLLTQSAISFIICYYVRVVGICTKNTIYSHFYTIFDSIYSDKRKYFFYYYIVCTKLCIPSRMHSIYKNINSYMIALRFKQFFFHIYYSIYLQLFILGFYLRIFIYFVL